MKRVLGLVVAMLATIPLFASPEAFLRNAVFDTATGKRVEEPPAKSPENLQGKPDVKPHGLQRRAAAAPSL